MSEARSGRRLAIIATVVLACAALAGPLVLVLGGGRSTAAFGDSERFGSNHLGAATLDVRVGEQTVPLSRGGLAPGDRVVGWLDLTNDGDLPLRYSISARTDGDHLGTWLRWSAWIAANCTTIPVAPVLATDVTLPGGTARSLTGDPTPGADPGDRTLDPDTGERVCLAVTVDPAAPNDVQGRSLTADLVVDAEHDLEATR